MEGEERFEREPVVSDKLYEVMLGDEETILSPKYDKIDYFPGFGHYILKILTEEGGMSTAHLTEDAARRVNEYSGVPFALRDEMFQSEYEGYIRFQTRQLDDGWLE